MRRHWLKKDFMPRLSPSTVITATVLLIAGGAFLTSHLNRAPVATAEDSTRWTQDAGAGISAPACSSSVPSTTCVGGAPKVTISWTPNGADNLRSGYNVCAWSDVSITGGPTWTKQPCTGSVNWYGAANNTAYTYSIQNWSSACLIAFPYGGSNYEMCVQQGFYDVCDENGCTRYPNEDVALGPPTQFSFTTTNCASPINASCAGAPALVQISENVTWTATSSGGSEPYTYSWSSVDPELNGKTNNPVTVQYPTAGTKLGQITVTDSLNNTVGPIACQSVTVTSGPQTLATEVSARRNNLDFWHTLQLTGGAPMNDVDLSSTISGSAAGTVNFTFFCNKNTPDTDTSEPRDAKFDGVDITQAYGPGPANAAPPGVIGNYFTFGNLNIEIWPAEKRFAVNDVCDYPTAGTYYPKVVAERQALAAEDRLSAGVVVSGDYVDLIIDSHNSAPPNPIPGQLMSFTGVVKNQGTIGAGASTARLRIDLNNNGWSPGEPEFTAPTGALAPNGGSETESWTNIWAAVLGTHRYQICADSTDVVVESNNANNCNGATTGVFIVAPKPQCSDSIDNDGDGKIDYPADPGCVSPEDNNELDNPDFQEVEP